MVFVSFSSSFFFVLFFFFSFLKQPFKMVETIISSWAAQKQARFDPQAVVC